MSYFKPQNSFLHRTWLRLLPYAMFGAFLITLKSTDNFSSLFQNYCLFLVIQLIIIALYVLIVKASNTKNN
jgi:hypothetical protein